MLTALEDRDAMIAGLGVGADDYIQKSSEFEVLRARVRAQIRRKQFEDEHRRIREELLQKELEAQEAKAARELAQTKAALVEELERKNEELEAFSYSVSHDLRAPLRAIDGFSQALVEDYEDGLDARAKGYLGNIRNGARRMAELIDDMLELSRVSRTDLRPRKVDLSAEARLIAEELHRREPDRRVEIVIQDGLHADADAGLMRIALENLLGNAWKFTRKTPDARIEFAMSEDGGTAVYEVRDNGAGFNMAYADRLFRPFRRLHGETEFPGTGIGLATVHRVIDRHGGRVWATGIVDKGANLFFTLGKAQEPRK
jgi:light-regulated signal transduction histidine kinase (bacteriophytochrome)